MDERKLLPLIGDIYEAATDPERLPAVGSAVRRIMGVESGIMFICEESSGRMLRLVSASQNFDAAARRDYSAYYHERNPWFTRAVARGAPYVALGEELIDRREFERTEFCNDWCPRVGIFHMIGGMYRIRTGVVVGSGIHRSHRQGAFSEWERKLYALVMSHLSRALQVAYRLDLMSREKSLSLEILHGLGVGAMLLDRHCRLLFDNAIAARLVRHSRWFSTSRGAVYSVDPRSNSLFQKKVREAAVEQCDFAPAPGGIVRICDPIEGQLPLLIAPFHCQATALGAVGRAAIVLFADPNRRVGASAERISSAFGLSATEGRVAAALLHGKTLVQYAGEVGVSVNTAKSQLASIFEKTGCSRQSTLVAAALSNPLLRYSLAPPEER